VSAPPLGTPAPRRAARPDPPTNPPAVGRRGGGSVLRARPPPADVVLDAATSDRVPPGCLAVSAVHRRNVLLACGETVPLALFRPPDGEPCDLLCLEVEALRLLEPAEGGAGPAVVDARAAEREVRGAKVGSWASVGERVLARSRGGGAAVLRVCGAHVLGPDEEARAIGHHCFRGRVTDRTRVVVVPSRMPPGLEGAREVRVEGADEAAAAAYRGGGDEVAVGTRDPDDPGRAGDDFSVKRALLRPCIALTQAVRGSAPRVEVPVDTLTFDRVLLSLEALHAGAAVPDFATWHLDALLAAAEALGLRALADHVLRKRGEQASRVREWRWDEVVARNAAGGCLVLVDSMVLDLGRWLPEHPGGDRIIPAQALDNDATVFFELYHASRESFMYLREFYCGELVAADRGRVPPPRHGEGLSEVPQPSEHFLSQLRAFTPWRLGTPARAFKSF